MTRKGYYIRTHNGRSSQVTMLREVQHGSTPMLLVKSTRCKDGSTNDSYDCGCIINRPPNPSSEGARPHRTTGARRPTHTPGTKRSKRDWLEELLDGMED